MVDFQRVIAAVALLLCVLWSGSASALFQPASTVGSCASSKPANVPAAGTIVGGCGSGTPSGNAPIEFRETARYSTSASCEAGPVCGSFGFQVAYTWTAYGTISCPVNSIPAGGSNCACAAGFVENNTPYGDKCVTEDMQKCQQNQISWNLLGTNRDVQVAGNQRDGEFCMPLPDMSPGKGCVMKFEWETSFDKGPDAGGWVSEGKGATPDNAEVCSTGVGDDMEKDTCKNGDKGTVNGVEVCVPRDPNKPTETKDGTKTTKTDPNGTKTETETKKETKCDGDKCTTTTTTTTTVTAPDGTKTTTTDTEGKEQGKGGFCEENPKSKVCGDGQESNFQGSCDGSFSCTGDAIQCAIAKEQHKRACQLFVDKTPESELYDTEKDKQGNRTKDLEGNETFDMNNRISSADLLGGGQGVQDLPITVAGSSITLPLSRINPYLQALGNVLLAVSFLMAVRIVGRG